MLPLGDDNTDRKTTPIITFALSMVNILVFFLEIIGGDAFIQKWSFVPARFFASPLPNIITIFTSMFMHAGWFHLISNMIYLWIFGDNVEDRFGHKKFLIFYLLAGVGASLTEGFFSQNSNIPMVGASGAIAGVLGAYLLLYPTNRVRVLLFLRVAYLPALFVIGSWFILQLFSGIGSMAIVADTGGVAYLAHVGGFISGFVMTLFLR